MYDAEKKSPGDMGITRLGADRSLPGATCAGRNQPQPHWLRREVGKGALQRHYQGVRTRDTVLEVTQERYRASVST